MTTHSSIRRGPAAGAKRPPSRRIAALFLRGRARRGLARRPVARPGRGRWKPCTCPLPSKEPFVRRCLEDGSVCDDRRRARVCAQRGRDQRRQGEVRGGAFTVGANVSITGAGSATVIDDPGAA